jgi:hypothetical protein
MRVDELRINTPANRPNFRYTPSLVDPAAILILKLTLNHEVVLQTVGGDKAQPARSGKFGYIAKIDGYHDGVGFRHGATTSSLSNPL